MSDESPQKPISIIMAAREDAGDTIQASIEVIDTFALQHIRTAVLFRNHLRTLESYKDADDQTKADKFTEARSYSSASILAAAASLEALINELFINPFGQLRIGFGDRFDIEFWDGTKKPDGQWDVFPIDREQVHKKYKIALQRLGNLKIDPDINKRAKNLVSLRNALTHFKPQWPSHDEIPDWQSKLIADLRRYNFSLSPFVTLQTTLDLDKFFIGMRCMSAGCADWAIKTVVDFVEAFENLVQLDAKKTNMFISIGKS